MRVLPPGTPPAWQGAATGCALLFLLCLGMKVAAQTITPVAAPEQSVSVGGSSASLTVIAEDVSLRDAMQYIAHHQRLKVEAHVPLHERVTLAIVEQPLAAVMRRLLRDYNFTLQLDGGDPGSGRLWIYPRDDATTRRLQRAEHFGYAGADDMTAALQRSRADSDAERLDGTAVLTAYGGDETFVALADALYDPDAAVREEAVVGLADHHAALSLDLLAQALFDADPHVVEAAVNALADIGSDEAIRRLAPLLQNAGPATRRAVVEAIGDVPTGAAGDLLRQALNDSDDGIRGLAKDYLAERVVEAGH